MVVYELLAVVRSDLSIAFNVICVVVVLIKSA